MIEAQVVAARLMRFFSAVTLPPLLPYYLDPLNSLVIDHAWSCSTFSHRVPGAVWEESPEAPYVRNGVLSLL